MSLELTYVQNIDMRHILEFNTLTPEQNAHHFSSNIFECMWRNLLNGNGHPVLKTKISPSVRDKHLFVKISNFLHISLQINVEIFLNSDPDRQLFQLSPEPLNTLVPSYNNLLPEPILAQIPEDIWCYQVTMN